MISVTIGFRRRSATARLGFLRQPPLRLVVHEDAGAVLAAHVAELRVGGQRIDVAPEHVEELCVGDLAGVVHDLDRLGVAGLAGRDLLVRRVRRAAARVAGGGRDDAVQLVERRLHAPEAAAGEGGPGELLRVARRRRLARQRRLAMIARMAQARRKVRATPFMQ